MIEIWNVICILHDYSREKVTVFCKQMSTPSKTTEIIYDPFVTFQN